MSGLRMNALPMYSGPANVPMQAPVRSLTDREYLVSSTSLH